MRAKKGRIFANPNALFTIFSFLIILYVVLFNLYEYRQKGNAMKQHIIDSIDKKSPAARAGIRPGDRLILINGQEIEDIFDYDFLCMEEELSVTVLRGDEELSFSVGKDENEDLGLRFTQSLMDEYHSCCNKCIFCFIDQMPPGMRETLYFKDDDTRLSFLQGNYITLTNLRDKDVERMIRYHLSPINISVHTTNPELRCKMLHNRFAGEALRHLRTLADAELELNGQIVLCKGYNDGAELDRSLCDLLTYAPAMKSVSVVPVGLTKYREGLEPLVSFEKEDAAKVIDQIEYWQREALPKTGTRFVYASDEWYILAGRELPREEAYDGYPQLENGVGMIRSMLKEYEDALEYVDANPRLRKKMSKRKGEISIATGRLAYPYILRMTEGLREYMPKLTIHVYEMINHFFGEKITVSGLITGTDLMEELQGKELGTDLFIPENMLRYHEDVFLDDVTIPQVAKTLGVRINTTKNGGKEFIEALFGHALK